MKLFCQYSGVPFTLPQLPRVRNPVLTVHPVFHLERRQLYPLYEDWQEGLLDDPTDARLLFLALLNSTNLIDWRATANPAPSIVQAAMPNVYHTCKWVTSVTLPAMRLPRFAITQDTRSLSTVQHWMRVWETVREDFDAGYKSSAEIERQKNREMMLEKLIKSDGETERFAGLLAQWAFDAADVPDNIRDYWRQILTCKGISIFSIPRADIEELVDHFEDHLGEHGSIYSYTLLTHARKLRDRVLTGLGFNIANSVDLVDIVMRSDYTILDDSDVTSTERINIQKMINSAPAAAPVESDYPNKVAYLRAKICWQMSERANEAGLSAEDKLQRSLDLKFKADGDDSTDADDFSNERII